MSNAGLTILRQPARVGVVLPYLGQIGLLLAALAGIPMLVAFATGHFPAAVRYGAVITALTIASIPISRRSTPSDMQLNEGLVITAAVFVLSPPIMAFPLASGGMSYGQALFEAVSAVTTTGLSTLATVEDKPVSFLFARAWIQWYGGLGIVALLPLWIEPGPAARHLLGMDQPESGNALTSARFFARRIVAVYLALTAAGFLLVWSLGADPFPALLHTLAAISTGGFSSFDASLAALGRPAACAVIFVSVCGALPFVVYLDAFRGRIRCSVRDPQARALLFIGLLGTFCLLLRMVEVDERLWQEGLFDAAVLAFSAQTTAGFSSVDVGALDHGTKLLLILMMGVGGSLGSTAGGIKLLRASIAATLLRLSVVRASLPHSAWVTPTLGGIVLRGDLTERVLLSILLFALTITFSWLPFVLAGIDPLDALFEVVSAVATVGLSVGVCRSDLSPFLQALLCLDMWLGRLEILPILVLLSPAAWRAGRR